MNEKNHNPDERMEGMLRKWGVDESARRAGVGPMPELTPQQGWRTILLRWGPPAAAAAMLLIAVGLFVAGSSRDVIAPAAQEQEDVQGLKTQLARTQADLQSAQARLAQASSRPTRELEQLQAELAALKQKFEKEKTDFLTRANQRIAALNHIIVEKDAQLTSFAEELKDVKKYRAALNEELAKLTKEYDRDKPKLAAAVSELDRVGKKYWQLLTDSQKAQVELATLKVRHKAVLGDFQRAYLAAAAAAGGGMEQPTRRINLQIRQSASRGARLLARCAEIRPSVQATSTGMLMDRLEVVLTRLNLLNPADPAEAKAFAALVRRGGLVKEIDVALAGGRQRADIRSWLLETRLILEGAENVG